MCVSELCAPWAGAQHSGSVTGPLEVVADASQEGSLHILSDLELSGPRLGRVLQSCWPNWGLSAWGLRLGWQRRCHGHVLLDAAPDWHSAGHFT